jgi:hypothetical protein
MKKIGVAKKKPAPKENKKPGMPMTMKDGKPMKENGKLTKECY